MKKFPLATCVFAGLSILWFAYMTIVYGTTEDAELLYLNGAIYGEEFSSSEWWRLVTPLIAHIGIGHLLSNLLLLVTLSPRLEEIIGTTKFAILYLLSGISGNLTVVFFDPMTVTAGASSAIFGLLGYLAFNSIGQRRSNLYLLAKSYFSLIVINMIYTFTSTGVSIAGHIGGFLAGLVLAIFIKERTR